jgi:hypothetical protein
VDELITGCCSSHDLHPKCAALYAGITYDNLPPSSA